MNNLKTIDPYIVITTLSDETKSMRKIYLTNKELSTLRIIYNNIKPNRNDIDTFIDSKSYKSLMQKGLVDFSEIYRGLVLTYISEAVIKSNKSYGSVGFDSEDERVIVEWRI